MTCDQEAVATALLKLGARQESVHYTSESDHLNVRHIHQHSKVLSPVCQLAILFLHTDDYSHVLIEIKEKAVVL